MRLVTLIVTVIGILAAQASQAGFSHQARYTGVIRSFNQQEVILQIGKAKLALPRALFSDSILREGFWTTVYVDFPSSQIRWVK